MTLRPHISANCKTRPSVTTRDSLSNKMHSRALSLFWLSVCFVAAHAQEHHQFRLLHRLLHPSIDDPHFAERGTIHIDSFGASFAPGDEFRDALEYFLQEAKGSQDALYQIALERPPTVSPNGMIEHGLDISSVKAVRNLF